MVISRRAVVNGFGQSATLGALASAVPAQLFSAEAVAPAPTYCLTKIYQRSEGAAFDGNVFRDQQLPIMIKAFGKTAERIELRMPMVAEGAPAPQIIATVNIWFRDVQGFLGQSKTAAKDLAAGMEKVTQVVPLEQVDQVLASLGEARSAVPLESYCYSAYFPAKEGGTVDNKYFAETFYPKVAQTYGSDAVRRIELTTPATPKSALLASAHIYIRDEVAYDAAVTKAPELFAELKNYTNIAPVQSLTRVHALG